MKEPADQLAAPIELQSVARGNPITAGPLNPPRPKPEPPVRPRSNGLAGWVLIAVSLIAVVYGFQSAGRRAAAELLTRDGSPDKLALAVKIDPANALAWRRVARTQANGVEALRKAAELLPGESEPLIDLALELEAQQDFAGVEQALQQAAAVDPGFLPRWSLANFYLRRQREEEFWTAIRAAVVADHSQTHKVAALCWRVFDDLGLILERAIPDDAEALRSFLYYLIERGDMTAVATVWERYEPNLRAADTPVLADLLDELLVVGEVDLALSVWNAMIDHGLLEYQRLSLPDGPYLTNADFGIRVSGLGFDWKVAPAAGVTRFQRANQNGEKTIDIRLSGGQHESTLLLTQIVPVPDDEELVFGYDYVSQQLPFETGMVWRVRDQLSGRVLAESSSIDAAEDLWNRGELTFRAPKGVRLLRLELGYERAAGTSRFQGSFVLRSLDLRRTRDLAAGDEVRSN